MHPGAEQAGDVCSRDAILVARIHLSIIDDHHRHRHRHSQTWWCYSHRGSTCARRDQIWYFSAGPQQTFCLRSDSRAPPAAAAPKSCARARPSALCVRVWYIRPIDHFCLADLVNVNVFVEIIGRGDPLKWRVAVPVHHVERLRLHGNMINDLGVDGLR